MLSLKEIEMQKFLFWKEINLIQIFFLVVIAGYSQTNLMPVSHYVFPKFEKGIVLMKDGQRIENLLNYNSLTEEMIFDSKGIKLAISQPENIDTVFIGLRKFVPRGNAFFEVLLKSESILYAEYKSKMVDPGKPAGYGGSSQTSAITTYSKYYANGRVYEMHLPEGFETQSSLVYWLEKNGNVNKFLNIRQLSKLFEDKADIFKAYTRKNVVDYDDQNSIIDLVRFMDAN